MYRAVWAPLALTTVLSVAACETSQPNGTPETVTATVMAPAVTLPAVTITKEAETVTVQPPARTVTVTVAQAGPKDVTNEYVAWRKSHYDKTYAEDAQQWSQVTQALLQATGRLDILTTMPSGVGGWNCAGEPARLDGVDVLQVQILYSNGTIFLVCPPGR